MFASVVGSGLIISDLTDEEIEEELEREYQEYAAAERAKEEAERSK